MVKQKILYQMGPYRLKAPILFLGLVLFFIGLTAYLCIWQLQRGFHRAEEQKMGVIIPQIITGNTDTLAPQDFAPIAVVGTFDTKHVFLIENKFYQERTGFEVLIPLHVKESESYLLVNAGFIPRLQARSILPVVPPIPTGEIKISGVTHYPVPNRFVHDWLETHQISWPLVIQDIDIPQMAHLLNISLRSYLIEDIDPNLLGLPKEKRHAYLSPARHYAYAFQWGVLSLTLLVCLGVTCIRKLEKAT